MNIFVVAPCMLTVSSPLFVQLMHTNYYKIVKLLKSFKIIIVAPPCFGLHKPSSGSSQPMLHQSYDVGICYKYRYFKLSVLWLHILFSPVMNVDRALCIVELCTVHADRYCGCIFCSALLCVCTVHYA